VGYVESGALAAKAFVLTQDDLETKVESLGLELFKLYQVAIRDLARMTGLGFGSLTKADAMSSEQTLAAGGGPRQIRARSQIVVD
jgi:endonuclease G